VSDPEEAVRINMMVLGPATPHALDDRAGIDQNTVQVKEKGLTSEFHLGSNLPPSSW
jgi:hypothetical protein